METVTLSLPKHALSMRALSANGFNEDHAAAVARNVTSGERDGCATATNGGCWESLTPCVKGKNLPDAGPQIDDRAPGLFASMLVARFRCWRLSGRCRCWWKARRAVSPRWPSTAACIFGAVCRY